MAKKSKTQQETKSVGSESGTVRRSEVKMGRSAIVREEIKTVHGEFEKNQVELAKLLNEA